MKIKYIRNITIKNLKFLVPAVMITAFVLFPVLKSSAEKRDCDANAIIYCGSYSISELKKNVDSNYQIKSYYNTIGIYSNQFNSLKNGYVYKDGRVVVGGRVVARNVYSSGRHYIPGSVRDKRFSYPIYWRHPSVSFKSSPLSAFVYLNKDGSFAYAIIKSCGNPVTLNYNAHVKYSITVNKWHDRNGDKRGGKGEEMLSGITFTLSGKGIRTVWKATNSKGTLTFDNIPNGTYKLQESYNPKYWKPTTSKNGIQYITVKNSNATVWVGNKWVYKKPTYNVVIYKGLD